MPTSRLAAKFASAWYPEFSIANDLVEVLAFLVPSCLLALARAWLCKTVCWFGLAICVAVVGEERRTTWPRLYQTERSADIYLKGRRLVRCARCLTVAMRLRPRVHKGRICRIVHGSSHVRWPYGIKMTKSGVPVLVGAAVVFVQYVYSISTILQCYLILTPSRKILGPNHVAP